MHLEGTEKQLVLPPHQEVVLVREKKKRRNTRTPPQQKDEYQEHKFIKKLSRQKLSTWASLPSSSIHIQRLHAGLTNRLFCVWVEEQVLPTTRRSTLLLTDDHHDDLTTITGRSNQEQEDEPVKDPFLFFQPNFTTTTPHVVLFRIYGSNVSFFYDTDFELQVFQTLSKVGLGPKILATFQGGRIEEWLEGRALLASDLQCVDTLQHIAVLLRAFHDMTPTMARYLNKHQDSRRFENAITWRRIVGWRDRARRKRRHVADAALFDRACAAVDELAHVVVLSSGEENRKEHGKSSEWIKGVQIAQEIVFCHNDLQENNILKNGNTGKNTLRLIDFEYSDFNPRGFDVANLFLEACFDYVVPEPPHFRVDSTAYPNAVHRRAFARAYLGDCSAQLVEGFLEQVEWLGLASHLVWGFWSIVRAPLPVRFGANGDFFGYAQARFEAYETCLRRLVTSEMGRPVEENLERIRHLMRRLDDTPISNN